MTTSDRHCKSCGRGKEDVQAGRNWVSLSELYVTRTRILAALHSEKGPFFLLMSVPGPLRPSTVFVQIILTSKWTGVSLKVSQRNWQDSETGPGEEKVNQLFKTNDNK
jgi:hypothetical protein